MILKYYINLDERGEFNADLRNENEETIFEIKSMEHLRELIDDGFMTHSKDIDNLWNSLWQFGVINKSDIVIRGN